MKITSIFEKEEITVSFEVFPPKTTTNYEAVEKAALGVAALKPSYMSVTYGAGGSTRGYTIKIAEKIQKERLIEREGERYPNYERLWIPLEERYYRKYHVGERADYRIATD